jgi:hypothetical protein
VRRRPRDLVLLFHRTEHLFLFFEYLCTLPGALRVSPNPHQSLKLVGYFAVRVLCERRRLPHFLALSVVLVVFGIGVFLLPQLFPPLYLVPEPAGDSRHEEPIALARVGPFVFVDRLLRIDLVRLALAASVVPLRVLPRAIARPRPRPRVSGLAVGAPRRATPSPLPARRSARLPLSVAPVVVVVARSAVLVAAAAPLPLVAALVIIPPVLRLALPRPSRRLLRFRLGVVRFLLKNVVLPSDHVTVFLLFFRYGKSGG